MNQASEDWPTAENDQSFLFVMLKFQYSAAIKQTIARIESLGEQLIHSIGGAHFD